MKVEVLLVAGAHHVVEVLLAVAAHQTAEAGARQVALGVQEVRVSLLAQQEEVPGSNEQVLLRNQGSGSWLVRQQGTESLLMQQQQRKLLTRQQLMTVLN